MSAGLAIATFLPSTTSSLIFSTRRANKAVNSDNIVVTIGNADVASGQVKNALDGMSALSKETKSGLLAGFKGAHEAIKDLSKEGSFFEGAGKVIGFTADHVNPVITAVSGVKVLCSDDKESALIEEGCALGGMFAFEGAAKNILELPKIEKDKITGEKISKPRVAFYKSNAMLKTQSAKMEKAVQEYCSTKKLFNKISLKGAPAVAKGLTFVTASISGWALGEKAGNKINELRKEKSSGQIVENNDKNSSKTTSKSA